MDDLPDHFESPEDAYFGFFRADSAKNPRGWAAVMSYPHVRVSHTGLYYCATAEEYADNADWTAREATGWVRSVGHEPIRCHASPVKVHIVGGWTRYNRDDEPILTNDVAYILTHVDGSWGIQARFGVDSFSGTDERAGDAAVEVVQRYVEAHRTADYDACAGLIRYPFVQVNPAHITRIDDADAMVAFVSANPASNVIGAEVQALRSGKNGILVTLERSYSGGGIESSIGLIVREAGTWKIAGASSLWQDG